MKAVVVYEHTYDDYKTEVATLDRNGEGDLARKGNVHLG